MASSVEEIVARFRADFYQGCPEAKASALFQEAWNWAVSLFRLREKEVTVPLVEGQREYDFDAAIAAVREAYYKPSAEPSDWQVLSGVSLDRLARAEPGWRATAAESMPARYYIRAESDDNGGKRVIGLDPLPPATTTGGYPAVTLWCIQRAPIAGSDTVPDFLLSDEWFLYEMAYRWAIRQDRAQIQVWQAMRDLEQARVSAFVKGPSDDVPAQQMLSSFTNRVSRPV